jgi:predicted dehydrogenase
METIQIKPIAHIHNDFTAKFGIPRAYGDWREMAAKEKPDGICVLTGVAATSRTASEVLLEGIPVMMEKPPGRNREEILAIIEASRKTNTPAMVAFNRRYSPLLTQMLAIREKECQEPIEYVRCDFTRHERMDLDFSTTSIHGIDAIRHLSGGAYTEATFRYQELNREKPAWNIYVDAKFDNGVYGQITFQPCSGSMFERYMISTRHWTLIAHAVCPGGGSDVPGYIEVFRNGSRLRDEYSNPTWLNRFDVYLAGYYGENAAFVDRLRNGFPAFNDLEMSLDAVELADCIRNLKTSWKKA